MNRAGFVLTGGQSSRMGVGKPLLPYRGRTLVEHVAGEVRAAAGEVTLIGGEDRLGEIDLPVVADLTPGVGPLAGVMTALSVTSAEWNLVVACDMPSVNAAFLRSLLDMAEEKGCECLAPVGPGGWVEALCAVYRRSCLPQLQLAADSGLRRMSHVLAGLKTVLYPVSDERLFENINTLQQWIRHEQYPGEERETAHV